MFSTQKRIKTHAFNSTNIHLTILKSPVIYHYITGACTFSVTKIIKTHVFNSTNIHLTTLKSPALYHYITGARTFSTPKTIKTHIFNSTNMHLTILKSPALYHYIAGACMFSATNLQKMMDTHIFSSAIIRWLVYFSNTKAWSHSFFKVQMISFKSFSLGK